MKAKLSITSEIMATCPECKEKTACHSWWEGGFYTCFFCGEYYAVPNINNIVDKLERVITEENSKC